MKGLKIDNSDGNLFLTGLLKVMKCLDDGDEFYWSILYFEGVGDLSEFGWNVLELDAAARESSVGVEVEWETLAAMAEKLREILDIILIGCRQREQIRRFDDDLEMNRSCEYVIELFDSSYALVRSYDDHFLECLARTFEQVEYIREDEYLREG